MDLFQTTGVGNWPNRMAVDLKSSVRLLLPLYVHYFPILRCPWLSWKLVDSTILIVSSTIFQVVFTTFYKLQHSGLLGCVISVLCWPR